MTLLCLTGWQQPTDSLSDIAPDAMHFDYSAYDNQDTMFAALPKKTSLAIGWSLGGQLLVQAIARGHLRPDALILLGAPFQWVTGADFKEGVSAEMAQDVRNNYHREPEAMLKNLNTLIALGDAHEKAIAKMLNADVQIWRNGMFWLDALIHNSCASLDYSAFPPTVIVHGLEDKVIRYANARAFMACLPQVELVGWPRCAHASHLHDAEALRALVQDHV